MTILHLLILFAAYSFQLYSVTSLFTGKIKELLHTEVMVPQDKMQLCGWVHKNDASITDKVSLP